MPPECASPGPKGRRVILLVGNESSLSGDEGAALGEAGYRVELESGIGGAARFLAAAAAAAAAPEILLLDADLHDGVEIVSSLRELPDAKDLPVLLLSSGRCPSLAAMAGEEGVYGVVARGAGAALFAASLGVARRLCDAQKRHVAVEERLGLALDGSGAGWWDWKVDTGGLTVSERWAEIVGYTIEELSPEHGTFETLLHPEDAVRSDAITEKYRSGEIQSHEIELRMRHKDGRWVWVLDRGKATERGSDGRLLRMSGMHFDITARKAAEDELKVLLRQKEGLMKELQHRVKNSLNLVSSLLRLELDELEEEKSKKVIRDSVSRIHSMSRIYERLYVSSDLQSVDLGPYVEELSRSIFSAYSSGRTDIRLSVESAEMRIDAERASALGLILNELLTNALKYAYPDGSGGPISVFLEREAGAARLVVADEGAGFPEGRAPLETQSLGLTLVKMLAAQIGATLFIEGRRGVRASVSFRP
jgi:PAS domain S-box-containing protein